MYLGSEAVSHSSNPLHAQSLHVLDTSLDNGVDIRHSMRVLAVRAPVQPGHQVEAFWPVEWHRIAVERVNHNSRVATLGKLVGHQLAVLPDANDIGDVENSVARLGLALGRCSYIGIDFVVDFGELASGLAPVDKLAVMQKLLSK